MMEIKFIKKADDKNIISCKRKDGTETWMHNSRFFVMHDLIHFAVEKHLKLQTAFYGMLASGIDIKDFDIPRERRTITFSDEAIFAEQLVNLLGIEYTQGRVENFIELVMDAARKDHIGIIPTFTEADLTAIRTHIHDLTEQWNRLPVGDTMTLTFN